MFDFETAASGIEFKVRQLADEMVRLRQQVADSDERCKELEEALKDKEILINNLKEENKLIKLGNRLTEGNDSAELKLKINQMIRAIDKSLELMRKEA